MHVYKLAKAYDGKYNTVKTAGAWALKSLLSLSEDLANKSEHAEFIKQLSYLTKTNISQEDFTEWLKLNSGLISFKLEDWLFSNVSGADRLSCYLGRARYGILSKTPISFDQYYDIKKSSVLNKYKSIPTLYFYEAEINNDSGSYLSKLNKNLYPYFFIVEALANLDLNLNDADYINNYLEKSKPILNKLYKSFKIMPKVIGFGATGTAFDIGDGKILKIFADEFVYNKAIAALNNLHDNTGGENEVMVYDVGKLLPYENNSIYYLINEKVTVLDDIDLKYSHNIARIISAIVMAIYNEKKVWDEIKSEGNTSSQEINQRIDELYFITKTQFKKEIAELTSKLNLRDGSNSIDWVKALTREIVFKFLSGRGDLHIGNIGISSSGYLKYFDDSHKLHEKSINFNYIDEKKDFESNYLQEENINNGKTV